MDNQTPTASKLPDTAVDHLVVAAATLEQGVAWCERTLGVVPGPGGRHALFGTHNRLLLTPWAAASAGPAPYLEIIAIDPEAPPPGRPRWFGLDDPVLQARLRAEGPRLHHLVVRTGALDEALRALAAGGFGAGVPLAASRETPRGLLRWRIAVPADGALPGGGRVPTLIEWEGTHPAQAMTASGLTLQALAMRTPLALPGVRALPEAEAGPRLVATLATPRGAVTLAGA
jgi:hypothetical protein